MTQINSQSDLILMSSFALPSYLTIRSYVYMILLYFRSLQSLLYSLLLGQLQLKLSYFEKGRQNFASNVTLYPCQRSRQNHLLRFFSDVTGPQAERTNTITNRPSVRSTISPLELSECRSTATWKAAFFLSIKID